MTEIPGNGNLMCLYICYRKHDDPYYDGGLRASRSDGHLNAIVSVQFIDIDRMVICICVPCWSS